MNRILVIPDTQVKPGVALDHMRWAAKAVKDYKPTHVVHLGDHWDFPSLSSYSSRIEVEGKRIINDINAGNEAMRLFWKNLKGLKKLPEFHFIFGNHEERLNRYVNDNPVLENFLDLNQLHLDGWISHPYREVFDISNVWFTHAFYQPYTGRPYGGTAQNVLARVGLSLCQGHRQGKEISARSLPNGQVQRALICGSYYLHDETYLGPQARETWRGLVVLHDVNDGDYDMMELSVKYLCRRYEKMELGEYLAKEYPDDH